MMLRRHPRLLSLIAVLVVVAGIAVMARWTDAPPIPASGDPGVPLHYFIAEHPAAPEVMECRLVSFEQSMWEIWHRPPSPCTLIEGGWATSGDAGATAFGARSDAILSLPGDGTGWQRLTLRAMPYVGIPEAAGQAVAVALNGERLGTRPVQRHWDDVTFAVPAGILRAGPNQIELRFEQRISPAQAGTSTGRRQLAATVESLSLSRAGGSSRRVAPPAQVYDPSTGWFALTSPGTLVVPAAVPAGAEALVLEARGRAATALAVEIRTLGGAVVDGGGLRLGAAGRGLARRSDRLELPIGDLAGTRCLVTIAVSGDLPVELSPLGFRAAAAGSSGPLEPAPASARRPDIVVITLDAARPDHFSLAGYHRQTTPAIDRFATSALVFSNAFALAPYTLCSVPTMITGLSPFDHGVRQHLDVLSPEAVTLAEQLGAAGYRTACFSATPNNSSAKGFDQGYQEFFELWKDVPRSTSRRAGYVSRRVIDWLATTDPSTPLHLQVHYLPPHTPYAPPDELDLFTDPGYAGPCDGDSETLRGLESGTIDPGDGCLEHVVGLYDGNLRAADAAVGRLLSALRERPRWDDTVVLITSDHGEAFLEHGFTGHNSTVHDEMLRVPFLLRLPTWVDAAGVDTDELVTLADIMPTLLGTAGLEPAQATDGLNLLADRPPGERRQLLVAANTNNPPELGLRTERWKAILWPSGQGWLYDVVEDPKETRNLALDEPAVLAGLGLILTERATRPPALAPTTERADITEEDREMLHALGYVDVPDGD